MRASVVEASSKKQIGRKLDRVIEELFEVESKESKGGRRKRRVPTFPLSPKVQRSALQRTSLKILKLSSAMTMTKRELLLFMDFQRQTMQGRLV